MQILDHPCKRYQRQRHRQRKRISLREPRRFRRRERQQIRPGGGGLGDGVHDDEGGGALVDVAPEDVVGPAVQDGRHGDAGVVGVEGEPLRRLGDVPDDEDQQADAVVDVCERDGPRPREEEIGAEADEQHVEDAQCGRCRG